MSTNTKLAEALRKLLKRDQRNTCTHEETHRGGFIWEICDACGAKWADDEGGKPEWKDPPEWLEAEQALAAHAAEQAQEPIAWQSVGGSIWAHKTREDDRPLYAAPVEQAAQAVPAGFKLVPVEPSESMLCALTDPFIAINGDNRAAFMKAWKVMLAAVPAAPAPEAQAGDSGLKRFLALAEAAGIKSINDLPGLIPALQATEAQAAGQDSESATSEEWERELSAVMPADFKDWWQNNRREWPKVAADVIRNQREDRDLGWEMAALAQRQTLTEWRPIETAPRDGSYVLVWPPTWNDVVSCAKWNEDAFAKRPRPYWSRADDMGRVSESRTNPPTHWMPLPAAPGATTGEQR